MSQQQNNLYGRYLKDDKTIAKLHSDAQKNSEW